MASSAGTSFGFECKFCRVTVDVFVGGAPTCPNCNRPMTPMSSRDAPGALANYTCPKCRSHFGLITRAPSGCPNCGAPIT